MPRWVKDKHDIFHTEPEIKPWCQIDPCETAIPSIDPRDTAIPSIDPRDTTIIVSTYYFCSSKKGFSISDRI